MKVFAAQEPFHVSLRDRRDAGGRARYDAVCTPDFFGFDRD
jgi:hypothetical protein